MVVHEKLVALRVEVQEVNDVGQSQHLGLGQNVVGVEVGLVGMEVLRLQKHFDDQEAMVLGDPLGTMVLEDGDQLVLSGSLDFLTLQLVC